MAVRQVKFAEYQAEITAMMLDMLHLEPQPVDIPIQYYINIDDYFPYGRFNQLVSTMFKCLKPGSFKDLDNLYAVKLITLIHNRSKTLCYRHI